MNEFNERIRQIEAELIDWNVPYLRKSTIQRSKCAKHLVTKYLGVNSDDFQFMFSQEN